MRIGELGAAAGVEVETIRYYEKRGLLPEPGRGANGYRMYAQTHLERLAFIRHCRALDMSLDDIGRLLELTAHPEAECRDVGRLIDGQLIRVRERLNSLHALERQLQFLRARCSSREQTGNCGILHELIAASQGEPCVCHSTEEKAKSRRICGSTGFYCKR
ncbi:Cd(II)/Pb(II)-responsive transcriptional regulator [Imhoffiella purpurea]|uniref:Transcriptional regulator, MerR family n=1 Tax=Imhoffiella purpurea TaxID=1249627 RepID=W9VAG0_9GAMM|nr:Cd(II)/Pb(II)-responsive transcriptional regulator [Imhoffiella purpurea]EXJ16419.1 Transcriptional regulator, MerR family [Imhoffiella purpurea]